MIKKMTIIIFLLIIVGIILFLGYKGAFFNSVDLFKNHNPNYVRYTNDSANFLSQALNAGGMIQTKDWHYDPVSPSKAWIHDKDLFEYLDKNGYINEKPIPVYSVNELKKAVKIYKVQRGDLLFQGNGRDKKSIHHSMMITLIDKDGLLYYSAHTPDRINFPVTQELFNDDGNPQTLYIVRIK